MAADDVLIQSNARELWTVMQQRILSFITVDHIPVMCCNLRYFTY